MISISGHLLVLHSQNLSNCCGKNYDWIFSNLILAGFCHFAKLKWKVAYFDNEAVAWNWKLSFQFLLEGDGYGGRRYGHYKIRQIYRSYLLLQQFDKFLFITGNGNQMPLLKLARKNSWNHIESSVNFGAQNKKWPTLTTRL